MKGHLRHLLTFALLALALLDSLALSGFCWNRTGLPSFIENASHTMSENIAIDGPPISAYSPSDLNRGTEARVSEGYGKLPLSFEANHGQADSKVKFISRGSGYSLFLSPTEAIVALSKRALSNAKGKSVGGRKSNDLPSVA
jgi:hypothetical protein